MEFYVKYCMELQWNMTVLHGVVICFRRSGIAMENVFRGDCMGFHVKYFIEFS